MKEQTANRVFDTANFVILLFCTLICLAPFLHIAAISLSSSGPILSGKVSLLPVELNLEAYVQVFTDVSMIRSLGFTVLLTGLFTLLCMLMTIAIGYPLVLLLIHTVQKMIALVIQGLIVIMSIEIQ
ncbi:hypothetical protein [Paenibacillus sp. PL2-23]|uniref:hypothetical protein n=1 Tax=Paenibacillus sp. PL2-23 TaxID=2100729 RepID=UPI0030F9C016